MTLQLFFAHEIFNAGAKLFECLGKGEAGRGVGYKYALFLSAELIAEVFILFLVVHGSKHFRVELRFDLVYRLDRITQIRPHGDKQRRRKSRTGRRKLSVMRCPCGVYRLRRHGGALQHIQCDIV